MLSKKAIGKDGIKSVYYELDLPPFTFFGVVCNLYTDNERKNIYSDDYDKFSIVPIYIIIDDFVLLLDCWNKHTLLQNKTEEFNIQEYIDNLKNEALYIHNIIVNKNYNIFDKNLKNDIIAIRNYSFYNGKSKLFFNPSWLFEGQYNTKYLYKIYNFVYDMPFHEFMDNYNTVKEIYIKQNELLDGYKRDYENNLLLENENKIKKLLTSIENRILQCNSPDDFENSITGEELIFISNVLLLKIPPRTKHSIYKNCLKITCSKVILLKNSSMKIENVFKVYNQVKLKLLEK